MVLPISSGAWERLQQDDVPMAELVDLHTPGRSFYWTTMNDNVITDSYSGPTVEYNPFPGQPVGAPTKGSDLVISTMQYIMANSGQVFDSLILGKELRRSTIAIRRFFVDTPALDKLHLLTGKLAELKWTREQIMGTVRDNWDTADRKFPYYNFQDTCIWKFGGTGCGFDTSSVTITLSIDVLSSQTQQILCVSGFLTQSFQNGHFNFGKFTATGGVNSGTVRTVMSHSGDLIFLSHPFGGSVESLDATVYPGCRKRRITDCRSKYDNEVNFTGFEWIPIQEDGF